MDIDSIINILNNIFNSSTINELYNISTQINIILEKKIINEIKYELLYKIFSNKEIIIPFSNEYYYLVNTYSNSLNNENKQLFNLVYYNINDIFDDKWNRWSISSLTTK